jgi:NAD(P)-dependent dehydrogenase (short-subunit alcohol dehydrogenase family)
MRILIVGAAGKTGRELVRQATARGHTVAAIAHRTPEPELPPAFEEDKPLCETHPDVDALLIELQRQLLEPPPEEPPRSISAVSTSHNIRPLSRSDLEQFADRIADRLAGKVRDLLEEFFCQSQAGAAEVPGL